MKIVRVLSWLPEKTVDVINQFRDFGKREDEFFMCKIKPEHKCQVIGCCEDIRWLYLRGGTLKEYNSPKENTFFSKADLKALLKYFLRPFRQTKLDQERERLCRAIIFRTCEKHREQNSIHTRSQLQKLGWYDKESIGEADETLFPTWLVLLISAYAILLVGALLLESSNSWLTQNSLLPPP